MAGKEPLLPEGTFDRLRSWDVPFLPTSAVRPVRDVNNEIQGLPPKSNSNPWVSVANLSDTTPTPSFERWARTHIKMGSNVPVRVRRATLLQGYLGTLASAARAPAETAAQIADQLRQSLEDLGGDAPHKREQGLQNMLKFFILHYMLLFAFQAVVQVGVTVVEVVNTTLWDENHTVKIVLIAIDWTLILLLMVELAAETWVKGLRKFLSIFEHKMDLLILCLSLTFCTFDTFVAPQEGTLFEHLYDGVRMALRLLRMWVFVNQIYMLLSHPLQIMASVYEEQEPKVARTPSPATSRDRTGSTRDRT